MLAKSWHDSKVWIAAIRLEHGHLEVWVESRNIGGEHVRMVSLFLAAHLHMHHHKISCR